MIARHFQSLSAWIDYAESEFTIDAPPENRSSYNPRTDFHGVSTRQEAFDLVRKGYPQGTQRMQYLLEKITHSLVMPTMDQIPLRDIEGCCPDVQAYIEGQPEDMIFFSSVESIAPPSILSVQLEMGIHKGITVNQVQWAGAILFAAMQMLRMKGCQVEFNLTATCNSDKHGNGEIWQSAVKLPNDLDLDTFAFLLTHPATHRIIVFSMREHESKQVRNHFGFQLQGKYGYGRSMYDRAPRLSMCDQFLTMGQLAQQIPAYNEQSALETSIRLINQLVASKFKQ